jgi:hypothetical protein
MRTFNEIVDACKPILISGEMFDGEVFENEQAVIFPDWTGEEESQYHDDLVTHWFDRDYWICFYHDEEIIGYESESMECVVNSYQPYEPVKQSTMNKYFADVRIFVRAESAEKAAQEINDALSYVKHNGGFEVYNYDIVLEMDMTDTQQEGK